MYTDGLESERLTTRFLNEGDIAAWSVFVGNDENIRYTSANYDIPKEQRADDWIRFTMERYRTGRYGLQALIEKSTGAFVGQCGLILQEVEGISEIEIGYHLQNSYRGMGYATEAASLFRDYAFEKNITASVISIIDPET